MPAWLSITRGMVPDVLTRDPQLCPVWEITGAEFSKAELHTAAGISIRFSDTLHAQHNTTTLNQQCNEMY